VAPLARALKGRSPELVTVALERVGEEAPLVGAQFTRLHSDDELAALDLGLPHVLARRVQDAAARIPV
jgi:hypothetical protein